LSKRYAALLKKEIKMNGENRPDEELKIERFACVWDALEEDPEIRADLKVRSELMMQIQKYLKKEKSGLNQTEAGKKAGLTQARMNKLLKGHINDFSLDALVRIAARLGLQVRIRLEAV
jgi:predicted XRE-type DNA-binding protein